MFKINNKEVAYRMFDSYNVEENKTSSDNLITGLAYKKLSKKEQKKFDSIEVLSYVPPELPIPEPLITKSSSQKDTTPIEVQIRAQLINEELERLFKDTKGFNFEDGMESPFSQKLESLIETYGDRTVNDIENLIFKKGVDPVIASEALVQLGDLDHPTTFKRRFELIIKSLQSLSPQIKYGASSGLSTLELNIRGLNRSIQSLNKSIEKEKNLMLKRHLNNVLAHLETKFSAKYAKSD